MRSSFAFRFSFVFISFSLPPSLSSGYDPPSLPKSIGENFSNRKRVFSLKRVETRELTLLSAILSEGDDALKAGTKLTSESYPSHTIPILWLMSRT